MIMIMRMIIIIIIIIMVIIIYVYSLHNGQLLYFLSALAGNPREILLLVTLVRLLKSNSMLRTQEFLLLMIKS